LFYGIVYTFTAGCVTFWFVCQHLFSVSERYWQGNYRFMTEIWRKLNIVQCDWGWIMSVSKTLARL